MGSLAAAQLWEGCSRMAPGGTCPGCPASVSPPGAAPTNPVSRTSPGTLVPPFPCCKQPLLMAIILLQMSKAEVTELCKPLCIPGSCVSRGQPQCHVSPWIQMWMCVPWLPAVGDRLLCAKGATLVLCCDPETDLLSPSSRGHLLYNL